MAQGKGVWGKILNFIGLVDDEDSRDTYDDTEVNTGSRGSGNAGYRGTPAPNNRNVNPQRRPAGSGTNRSYPPRGEGNRGYGPQKRPAAGAAPARNGSAYTAPASRFDDPSPRQQTTPPEPKRRPSQQRQTLVTVRIETLDDCCDVIDNLILNKTVALNMEELDTSVMQRCIDTLSGAVFALDATMKKIGEGTYMLAPKYVEVSEIYSDHKN